MGEDCKKNQTNQTSKKTPQNKPHCFALVFEVISLKIRCGFWALSIICLSTLYVAACLLLPRLYTIERGEQSAFIFYWYEPYLILKWLCFKDYYSIWCKIIIRRTISKSQYLVDFLCLSRKRSKLTLKRVIWESDTTHKTSLENLKEETEQIADLKERKISDWGKTNTDSCPLWQECGSTYCPHSGKKP